jgi:hypothetical protein
VGDHLRKVRSGERLSIPAETFNSFIDAARDFRERRQRTGARPAGEDRAGGTLLVRNDCGFDVGRFNVLGVSWPLFDPGTDLEEYKNEPAFSCVVPTEAGHLGRFVITTEPIASGEVGYALATGVCPVQIDIQDPAELFADVTDGVETHLTSGTSGGAAILWTPGSTGIQWTLVRLPAGGGGGEAEIVYQ